MFPLDAATVVDQYLVGKKWAYFCCTGFEDRFLAFPEIAAAKGAHPSLARVIAARNGENQWADECLKKEAALWKSFCTKIAWTNTTTEVELVAGSPWETSRRAFQDIVDAAADFEFVVVDISTMPKACYFPIVHSAVLSPKIRNLMIVYAKPEGYFEGTLHADPTTSILIPGFDQLPPQPSSKIAWMPLLGFGPHFADYIYQTLVDTYDIASRIFPIVGFPAYNPTYFERVVNDSARAVLNTLGDSVVRDQFVYAAAGDPFETRQRVSALVRGMPDVSWIGSPLGPKPMALGLLLAALDEKITIVAVQARSYHPEYSHGIGEVQAYLLKRDGIRAY